MLARLEVDLPDGSALVAVDLTGDEVARLLAGETLAVPVYVALAALVEGHLAEPVEAEQLEQPLPVGEVEQLAEPVPDGNETPDVSARDYGSNRAPPTGPREVGSATNAARSRWTPGGSNLEPRGFQID